MRGIIRASMALAAGTKLDGYEVLSLLGEGGMGEVYRARDPVLRRDVAIKVLPAFVSQDPERMRRFQQEAQAAAALNHPNILAVYQLGNFEGTFYRYAKYHEEGRDWSPPASEPLLSSTEGVLLEKSALTG